MEAKTYKGLLSIHNYGEADDVLFLSSLLGPLAEELYWISNKNVTVRYWITDKEATKDEAIEGFINTLIGRADAKLVSHYSELTGYLWTDEDLVVGGHDLMEELKSYTGKWLILEIEVNKRKTK